MPEVFDFSKTPEITDGVPYGNYLVEVVDYEEGLTSDEAKNPGAAKVTWTFSIASGEYEGEHIRHTTVVDPTLIEGDPTSFLAKSLRQFFVAFGKMNEEGIATLKTGWDELLDQVVIATISAQKRDDGSIRNNIRRLRSTEGVDLAAELQGPQI